MGLNATSGTFRIQVSPRRAGRLAGVSTVAGAALLLSACGGGTGGSGTPTGTAHPTAGANAVTVTETEFSIQLSETNFTPGTHTFRVENQGSSRHNLNIQGPGMNTMTSPVINGGETTELTVTLQPGTYQVWCSVDNHRAQGMDTTITVR